MYREKKTSKKQRKICYFLYQSILTACIRNTNSAWGWLPMSWHAVKEEQQQIPSANKSNRLQANAARFRRNRKKKQYKNQTKQRKCKEIGKMLKCIWNRQYCALWNAIYARDEIVWSIFDGLVIEHHAKHHSCWVNILLTLQSFCTNRLTGWLTVAIRIMINHTQYALFISSAHSSLGMSLCVCVCAH